MAKKVNSFQNCLSQ